MQVWKEKGVPREVRRKAGRGEGRGREVNGKDKVIGREAQE
jgi:hypothetical protein